MEPCQHCPWLEPKQPAITAEVRAAAERGEWFCCHVHMGTCAGARLVSKKAKRSLTHDQ